MKVQLPLIFHFTLMSITECISFLHSTLQIFHEVLKLTDTQTFLWWKTLLPLMALLLRLWSFICVNGMHLIRPVKMHLSTQRHCEFVVMSTLATYFQCDLFDTYIVSSVSSVPESCPTLCNPTDCSMGGLPVHHQIPELIQTHVHRAGDAIQPSHPLSSPSSPTFNLYQYRVFSNQSVLRIR